MVQWLVFWTATPQVRVQIPARAEICVKISAPPTNSITMSSLTMHCQWEEETAMEKADDPSSYAEAKKMKLLTSYPWLPQGWRKGLLLFFFCLITMVVYNAFEMFL